jgi:hypothetical protein
MFDVAVRLEKNKLQEIQKQGREWSKYISDQLRNKEDLSEINDYSKILEQATPVKIKRAVTKYLQEKNMTRLIELPQLEFHSKDE